MRTKSRQILSLSGVFLASLPSWESQEHEQKMGASHYITQHSLFWSILGYFAFCPSGLGAQSSTSESQKKTVAKSSLLGEKQIH